MSSIKPEDITVKVEFSADTSKKFTEACLKVIRRREKKEAGRLKYSDDTN